MPSHIYLLVGDHEKAARSNEEAVAADREYIREYGTNGIYPLHYLSHNIFFLSRAYTLEGRFEDSRRAANELTGFYGSHFNKMPASEYYATAPLTVLMTFHRWKDILEMQKPSEDMHVTTVLWHFARAMAYANLGDLPRALYEQRLFLEGKDQITPDQVFGYNLANQILLIAQDTLDAKLAEVQRDFSKAIDFLQKAVNLQDGLRYNEPPDWFFPVRITLGGVLLRMQKLIEAEKVFRQELKRHPRNGWALFGLRESLRAQSKKINAYWVNEEFQTSWKYSPISLTINDL